MVRTRFALIHVLYFRIVADKAACHTLSKALLKSVKTWYRFFFMLEVLYAQDFEVEDLFRGASSGSEPGLFFSNYLFGLGFKPIQDDFQHDFFFE